MPEFLEAYEKHVWDVYGFFAYRLATRADAEDLTQQTFERALRGWERFDPGRASARTWLLTIARNLLIDHYRRDRTGQQEQVDEAEAKGRLGAADPPEERLGVEPELGAALTVLSERERELIALRFGGDLTGREIADLTGLTLANVQQILSRSLRRLRAELEDRESAQIRNSAR